MNPKTRHFRKLVARFIHEKRVNQFFRKTLREHSCIKMVDGYIVRLHGLNLFAVSKTGHVHLLQRDFPTCIDELYMGFFHNLESEVYEAIEKGQPVEIGEKVTNLRTLREIAQILGKCEPSLVLVITP
jgi:hypothetical protein